MNHSELSARVKNLRKQKGLSQEALAESAGLSLRTIQRIENNETVPRGDSLQRLARALDSSPDEIIDWKTQEDKGYLSLMSLSALSFLFFPILGILLPLVFWMLKKDKVKQVNEIGKSILNFEITWTLLFFGYFILLFFGLLGGAVNTISPVTILLFYIPVIILYLYNIVVIVGGTIRVSKNKRPKFVPAIPFLR